MKSLNILNVAAYSKLTNWWSLYKNMELKIVLCYLLQQNISFELHMIYMLNSFPLRLGEADAAVWFDILNLIITIGYYCNNFSVGGSLRVILFGCINHCSHKSPMGEAGAAGWTKILNPGVTDWGPLPGDDG